MPLEHPVLVLVEHLAQWPEVMLQPQLTRHCALWGLVKARGSALLRKAQTTQTEKCTGVLNDYLTKCMASVRLLGITTVLSLDTVSVWEDMGSQKLFQCQK